MNKLTKAKFTLREALYLGFCATFIILARVLLRLKLNVPGHAMFFVMFFILLGRGCVPKMGAASLVGLIAGVLSTLMGLGKGPLLILKFICPGLVVDLGAAFYPRLTSSYVGCIIVGGIASFTRFAAFFLIERFMGMETGIIWQKAILDSTLTVIFGCLGSAMVPAVVRRLKANKLIS
ncbi:MAG: hypothetical protein OS130_00685 [Thermodesulfobacteriota bacterium]|nr:MAG: hypothetical protein OS130_00685 [Thermodesulfobacteriota bacterium]